MLINFSISSLKQSTFNICALLNLLFQLVRGLHGNLIHIPNLGPSSTLFQDLKSSKTEEERPTSPVLATAPV